MCLRMKKFVKKSKKTKKNHIAGAGPAGINCALSLHERGHMVEIYEKNKQIGGKLIASSVKGLIMSTKICWIITGMNY